MTLVGDFVTGQTVPFQRMRQLLADHGGLQEGVVGAGDFKVTQRAAGATRSVDVAAGLAWVQVDTGTRNGLAHASSDAVTNLAINAAHASLPRIDQIVLRYNDTAIPTGSGNAPTLEVLTGTATSGATLDNRSGAAALPNDCVRWADVLLPAAATSVVNANIRDRRPWARGGFRTLEKTDNDFTTTSTTSVAIATAGPIAMECSGVTLRIVVSAKGRNQTAGQGAYTGLKMDGADLGSNIYIMGMVTGSALAEIGYVFHYTPAAGRHVFQPSLRCDGGTAEFKGTAGLIPARFAVEEIVRQNTDNS